MKSPDIQEMIGVERQRQFIRAMSKSIEGQPVSEAERALLNSIFEALLRGEDVSDLIGIHPPRTRRANDPVHVALHYLCLTKLMHEPPEAAWRIVGDAWGLKKRDLQWIIADNRAAALTTLEQFAAIPDTLLRLCERHARGTGRERRHDDVDSSNLRARDPLDAT